MTPDDLGVRHLYATVNGLRMHYVEKGDGPLVVLLHGFPEMWWSWRYQIVALAEAGFRVVAPDLRGYGETEPTGPFDVDVLRDDVVALFDHLGVERPTVVAHDWGGGVAWHLASTRPSRCAKLVVMNCPHPVLFQKALTKPSQLKRSWYMFFFQLPVLPELMLTRDHGRGAIRMLRALAVDKTNFGDDELRPLAEAVRKPGRPSAMIGWYRAMMRRALRELPKGSPMFARYGKVRIPTLLLWALDDRALGYEDLVPGTERYVPDVEVQTIAGCGHFVQQEQPREVNRRLVEFLKRREPARDAGSPLRPT
jgi:pimeloyl-ACP methyl ester carboxylesterase